MALPVDAFKLDGISPRYIQDKIANALVSDKADGAINPFMVLNELESGLRSHSLINSDEQRKRFAEMLSVVKQEYEDIVKNEVQRAISADDMKALLLGAAAASGEPLAFLLPIRDDDLFAWALSAGLRLVKPMNLMAIGEYVEPRGSWFPSVIY